MCSKDYLTYQSQAIATGLIHCLVQTNLMLVVTKMALNMDFEWYSMVAKLKTLPLVLQDLKCHLAEDHIQSHALEINGPANPID